MKVLDIKIGIFRFGFSFGSRVHQHIITARVTMEGKKFRAWKRRVRKSRFDKSDSIKDNRE